MTPTEYFNHASEAERYVLCLFTLFDVTENEVTKARSAIEKLIGRTFIDYKLTMERLGADGMLTRHNYNWRTESYDYYMTPGLLTTFMEFFYSQQPDLTIRVLNNSEGLRPSAVQRMLWNFISSGFNNLRIEDIDDAMINSKIDAFVPCLSDERYRPLLMVMRPETFFTLINNTLHQALENDILLKTSVIRQFIDAYDGCTIRSETQKKETSTFFCDLYDYIAYGVMPPSLFTHSMHHQIIAALRNAYAGNGKASIAAFKEAVGLNNQSGNAYRNAKAYTDLRIVNFAYMMATAITPTDDSRKRALALQKSNEHTVTAAAKLMYSIIYGGTNDGLLTRRLDEFALGGNTVDKQLCLLMKVYQKRNVNMNQAPQLLMMKQEYRHLIEYDEETKKSMDNAYGTEGLVAGLRAAMDRGGQMNSENELQSGVKDTLPRDAYRIAYLITDTKATQAEMRQQTILRTGLWSAGKRVRPFLIASSGVDPDGMNATDHAVMQRIIASGQKMKTVPLEYVLPAMTEEKRLQVGRYTPYTTVEVSEELPYITLKRTDEGFSVQSNVPADKLDCELIITHTGASSINFIKLNDTQRAYYRRLLKMENLPLEAEESLKELLEEMKGKIEVNSDLIEGGSTLTTEDGNAQLVMQMRPHDKETYLVSVFVRPLEGGKIRCFPGRGDDTIVDMAKGDDGMAKHCRVVRNLEREHDNMMKFISGTHNADLLNATVAVPVSQLLPILDFAQQHTDLISCEWPEGARMKIKYRAATASWGGTIRKNQNGWFDIEGNIEVEEGRIITMTQLLDLASQSQGNFIKLGDGDFLALSDKLRKQLDALSAIVGRSHGRLQMSPFSAALLGTEMLDGELKLEADEDLNEIRRKIKDSSTYAPEVPKNLNATLRNYQKDGYQWIARLNSWGAGALLADDMGLGKTIQTITFLLAKAEEGPSLVIAPASVAPNWISEIQKFAPGLNVTMLNFSQHRGKTIENAKAGEIVVTTYGLLLSVEEEVTSKKWNVVCLDEAHIIKNRGAKTSAVAMKLKMDYRIMLTGTPVQNHLGELWNLFQFVNPGLLGSFEDFNRRFIVPIEQYHDATRQGQLDRLVKPFMLRRTKDKVATELPDKQEIYQRVELSEKERVIYESLRRMAEKTLITDAQDGTAHASLNALTEIMHLRQCACDTRLVENVVNISAASANQAATAQDNHMMGADAVGGGVGSKIIALIELLQGIIDGGGHTLVFSQFTSYLALIKQALDDANIPYLYIDGSLPIAQRQKLVDRFQKGECPVFLISLKAGGLGLNLTRANYVIHMDPWWNPAIEAQATDRAHRLGQKNAVTVYHFIAAGTIEEKIQRLHERKQALAKNILDSTDMSFKLTGQELLEMIRG